MILLAKAPNKGQSSKGIGERNFVDDMWITNTAMTTRALIERCSTGKRGAILKSRAMKENVTTT